MYVQLRCIATRSTQIHMQATRANIHVLQLIIKASLPVECVLYESYTCTIAIVEMLNMLWSEACITYQHLLPHYFISAYMALLHDC